MAIVRVGTDANIEIIEGNNFIILYALIVCLLINCNEDNAYLYISRFSPNIFMLMVAEN